MKKGGYKCYFQHCVHNGEKIQDEDVEYVNGKRFHKDCANEKYTMDMACKLYYDYIDNTVNYKILVGVMNTIAFKQGYGADFVLFIVKYIIAKNCTIRHPYGLHLFVKNGIEKKYNNNKVVLEVEDEYMNKIMAINDLNQREWDERE